MLLRGLFCLLFIEFASARLDMKNCGISLQRQPRIIGGKSVNKTAYPWMVSIEMDRGGAIRHACGGSIINTHWIVTAAHCTPKFTGSKHYLVYVGLRSQYKKDAKYIRRHRVSEVIIHPKYDETHPLYDIALLKTDDPIDIEGSKGHVNGICLPESDSPYPIGHATVIGWGYTSWRAVSGKVPVHLKEVDVVITPPYTCWNSGDDEISGHHVCAGGNGKNVCEGDSGGPLFQIKKGVAYLIGIASHTQKRKASKPTMFIRVSSFLDWMEKNMT